MPLSYVLATYFVIWWLVLLMVLPWGVHSQHESGDIAPGTEPGAPAVHVVWKKLMWTTVVATAIFAVGLGLYRFHLIPIDWLIRFSNPPHH
jgi:predicted secreted protein